MNNACKVVWSHVRQQFVVVSEIVSSGGKTKSTRATARMAANEPGSGGRAVACGPLSLLAMACALAMPAAWAQAQVALPTGGQVVAGTASIQQSGNAMTITQGSTRAAIDWQSFSVGSGASVQFVQPSAQAVALNRVLGSDVSVIQGAVRANGQVFLVNPNGVLFTPTAQVEVGALVASTQNISPTDFMAGRYRFSGSSTASVENQGRIDAAEGGTVALIAARVVNSGQVTAPGGAAAMVAANTVTLDLGGPVLLQVEQGALNAAIEQSGGLRADGGTVYLTAQAASHLAASVINHSGVTEARTLGQVTGRIALSADIVGHSGTLDASGNASGQSGGQIAVNAALLMDSGTTRADGHAQGGTIVQTAIEIEQTRAAQLSANSTHGQGGQVRVLGDAAVGGSAWLSGRISATGVQGGQVDATAHRLVAAGLQVDASGTQSAGQVRLGGGWQGQDSDLANATTTVVDGHSQITNEGANGRVVVWADDQTRYSGHIQASGSAAEVSGKGTLQFGGTAQTASLLLDPMNITIQTISGSANVLTIANPNATVGDGFGTSVTELSNGNLVVVSGGASVGGVSGAGRVYLYSPTGSLISSISGSTASDGIGSTGVTALTNDNFVFRSNSWDGVGGTNLGAVTFGNGSTGFIGSVVGSGNSLVGSTANDQVGSTGVVALTNGNYVVASRLWNNGGSMAGAGAVTWGDGSIGTVGAVSASNSLVGSTANDFVGNGNPTMESLGVFALTNGHYVVTSPYWNGGGLNDNGAVTWGNGLGGTVGSLSSSNSLVGGRTGDNVGKAGVIPLTNGNYVVRSPSWSNGTFVEVGAATWGNGSTNGPRLTGTVDASNSLVGSSQGDQVGGNVTALTNGNYVVWAPSWGGSDLGAVTWGHGGTGTAGVVSSSNSLVGSNLNDQVGLNGVTALSNGHYVVSSPMWSSSGTMTYEGAVTWGDGSASGPRLTGAVSAANSLVGSRVNDRVGEGQVLALKHDGSSSPDNGHYVVISPRWSNGTAAVGAVTWRDGSAAQNDVVSASNSLLGSTVSDFSNATLTALTNGHYVLSAPFWNNGSVANAGAVLWGNGSTGLVGTISASNALVGSQTNDNVGMMGAMALSNGHYVVSSPFWDNGSAGGAGAATWGNGSTNGPRLTGVVSASNSLVGSSANDAVGMVISQVGNAYVVRSPFWTHPSGNLGAAGAMTWADASTGITGAVSASNSMVGTRAAQRIGSSVFDLPVNGWLAQGDFNGGTGGQVLIFKGMTSGSGAAVSSATFSNSASGDTTITPTDLRTLLDAGTAVTLQANSDITLASALVVNNASGNGGNLTLLAGRDININSQLVTDNGNFTAVAGSTSAAGAVSMWRGGYSASVITLGSGGSIDAGTGTVNLVNLWSEGRFVNSASAAGNAITAGATHIYLSSPDTSNTTYLTLGGLSAASIAYSTTWNENTRVGSCATAGCAMPTSGLNLLYASAVPGSVSLPSTPSVPQLPSLPPMQTIASLQAAIQRTAALTAVQQQAASAGTFIMGVPGMPTGMVYSRAMNETSRLLPLRSTAESQDNTAGVATQTGTTASTPAGAPSAGQASANPDAAAGSGDRTQGETQAEDQDESSGTERKASRVAKGSDLMRSSGLVRMGLLRVVEGGINWQSAGISARPAQP